MKPLFSAQMTHNSQTISTLASCQYRTFRFSHIIIWLISSIALIVTGIVYWSTSLIAILAVCIGCWMLSNSNLPAKHLASKYNSILKDHYPSSTYMFYKDCVILEGGTDQQKIRYDSFIKLIKDKDYRYLFISSESAYMLDVHTIEDLPGFDKFISSKTNKKWQNIPSLLTYRISIIDLFRNNKKDKA